MNAVLMHDALAIPDHLTLLSVTAKGRCRQNLHFLRIFYVNRLIKHNNYLFKFVLFFWPRCCLSVMATMGATNGYFKKINSKRTLSSFRAPLAFSLLS